MQIDSLKVSITLLLIDICGAVTKMFKNLTVVMVI